MIRVTICNPTLFGQQFDLERPKPVYLSALLPENMGGPDGECDCKVGRVLARRGRTELSDELRRQWANGEQSLRDLARIFNLAVLRSATEQRGVANLDGETENLYRLLTDDDVTSGTRTQARNRLRRHDVDVESLEADFVSHQTIHNHLKNCLGVEREDDGGDPAEAARRRVRSLQNRMEAVTSDAVGRIDGGGYDVYVDVSVTCPDCGTRHEFGEVVDSGGCDCRQ